MTLREYLKQLDKEKGGEFADKCGTSLGYLVQLSYGNRNASPELAINIERESKGYVRCEELCPSTDWAYIRGSEPTAA